jgi:hypothetical protein
VRHCVLTLTFEDKPHNSEALQHTDPGRLTLAFEGKPQLTLLTPCRETGVGPELEAAEGPVCEKFSDPTRVTSHGAKCWPQTPTGSVLGTAAAAAPIGASESTLLPLRRGGGGGVGP